MTAAQPANQVTEGVRSLEVRWIFPGIVMQENRSSDTCFGTYPGAVGIPRKNGVPAVCVPKPGGGCARPYHLTADINSGGPHNEGN